MRIRDAEFANLEHRRPLLLRIVEAFAPGRKSAPKSQNPKLWKFSTSGGQTSKNPITSVSMGLVRVLSQGFFAEFFVSRDTRRGMNLSCSYYTDHWRTDKRFARRSSFDTSQANRRECRGEPLVPPLDRQNY